MNDELIHQLGLPALFLYAVLCTAAIYTDIKSRIIPNVVAVGIVAVGVLAQITWIVIGLSSGFQVALTVASGIAIGLTLYLLGYWAPGDGKLFIGAALVVPPVGGEGPYMPAPVRLAAVIFACTAAVFLIWNVRWLFRRDASTGGSDLQARPSPRWNAHTLWSRCGTPVLQFLALCGIMNAVAKVLPFNLGILGSLLLAAAFGYLLRHVSVRTSLVVTVPCALYGGYALARSGLNGGLLGLTSLIGLWAGKKVMAVAGRTLAVEVSPAQLQPGNYLDGYVGTDSAGKCQIVRSKQFAAAKALGFQPSFGPDTGALTPADVKAIATLLGDSPTPAGKKVPIVWAVPLAPVIVAGSVIMIGMWIIYGGK